MPRTVNQSYTDLVERARSNAWRNPFPTNPTTFLNTELAQMAPGQSATDFANTLATNYRDAQRDITRSAHAGAGQHRNHEAIQQQLHDVNASFDDNNLPEPPPGEDPAAVPLLGDEDQYSFNLNALSLSTEEGARQVARTLAAIRYTHVNGMSRNEHTQLEKDLHLYLTRKLYVESHDNRGVFRDPTGQGLGTFQALVTLRATDINQYLLDHYRGTSIQHATALTNNEVTRMAAFLPDVASTAREMDAELIHEKNRLHARLDGTEPYPLGDDSDDDEEVDLNGNHLLGQAYRAAETQRAHLAAQIPTLLAGIQEKQLEKEKALIRHQNALRTPAENQPFPETTLHAILVLNKEAELHNIRDELARLEDEDLGANAARIRTLNIQAEAVRQTLDSLGDITDEARAAAQTWQDNSQPSPLGQEVAWLKASNHLRATALDLNPDDEDNDLQAAFAELEETKPSPNRVRTAQTWLSKTQKMEAGIERLQRQHTAVMRGAEGRVDYFTDAQARIRETRNNVRDLQNPHERFTDALEQQVEHIEQAIDAPRGLEGATIKGVDTVLNATYQLPSLEITGYTGIEVSDTHIALQADIEGINEVLEELAAQQVLLAHCSEADKAAFAPSCNELLTELHSRMEKVAAEMELLYAHMSLDTHDNIAEFTKQANALLQASRDAANKKKNHWARMLFNPTGPLGFLAGDRSDTRPDEIKTRTYDPKAEAVLSSVCGVTYVEAVRSVHGTIIGYKPATLTGEDGSPLELTLKDYEEVVAQLNEQHKGQPGYPIKIKHDSYLPFGLWKKTSSNKRIVSCNTKQNREAFFAAVKKRDTEIKAEKRNTSGPELPGTGLGAGPAPTAPPDGAPPAIRARGGR